MDPSYSAEADAFRGRIRAFLAENRFLAPAWPTGLGGGGLSGPEQVVPAEESRRTGMPTGGFNHSFRIQMVDNTILHRGTDGQKAHFLPRIINGDDVWCQGCSEPDAPKHRGINFILCPMEQEGVEVLERVSPAGHRARARCARPGRWLSRESPRPTSFWGDLVGSANNSASWLGAFDNARAGTIYAGTSQIQRNILARWSSVCRRSRTLARVGRGVRSSTLTRMAVVAEGHDGSQCGSRSRYWLSSSDAIPADDEGVVFSSRGACRPDSRRREPLPPTTGRS